MSSTDDLGEALAPFFSAENVITEPISSLSTLFFIYGVYCVVFGFSIRALFCKSASAHKIHKIGTIALFLLATIYTVVYTWGTCRQTLIYFHAATTKEYDTLLQYLSADDRKVAWGGTTSIISTLMNSIADTMLIHRCYIIYNRNKYILYPLVVAAFILNGLDLGCMIATTVGYGGSSKAQDGTLVMKALSIDNGVVIGMAVFQVVLTFMTGGRMWWIIHEARKIAEGVSTHKKLNNIVAIIIESALIYAAALLLGVVLDHVVWDPDATGVVPLDLGVISVQISGLAPTMVIARVAYGKSVDSVQQTLSTFQIADLEASQRRSLAMRQHTIDLQKQTQLGVQGIRKGADSPLDSVGKV